MRPETFQQRRIGLAVIGILVAGIVLVLISQIAITGAPLIQIAGAAVGLAVAVILLTSYWYGWQYARHVTVVFFTLLAASTLPEPYVSSQVSFAVLIPPVLALILVSPVWVVGSAVVVLAGILIRSSGQGVYSDPITIVLFGMVVGGMILARIVTDTALRIAEQNAHRADTERARAEQQARELVEANDLMTVQLDQQQQLLDLVATLETPAVPLAEGVLFAPIVGHIDARRAQQLTSRLLHEASAQRARLVVLDIAGVSVIDTSVARALLGTTQALRLLGCKVTISGISASVAMTLIQLGINLDEVTTARSPQEALSRYLTTTAPPIQGKGNGRASYN